MKAWQKGILIALAALVWGAGLPVRAAMPEDVRERLSERQLANAEMMALLWMRTAAEYRALCYQGYNMAMAAVDRALARPHRGKPLAIVLDCDETVTDNTAAMARSAADGNGRYTSPWWRDTVHAANSGAMPGAVEFLQKVHQKGVAIFYVTNRYSAVNYDATVQNLKALGFPSVDREHLLLMEDTKASDKQPRFDAVARDYDVVVYMGDNAGDLPLRTKGKDLRTRNAIIDAAKNDFGTLYIVFPNPAYGAWISALARDYLTMDPGDRSDFYRATLLRAVPGDDE